MQMYRVKAVLNAPSGPTFVEGLVCASNAEAAGNTVAMILEWPTSKCSFTAERVKPSYYELSRRSSTVAVSDGSAHADYMAQPATWWAVSATMKVRARTENGAVKGAARARSRRQIERATRQHPRTRSGVRGCERRAARSRD
jgi:hypothetical protein